mgnify:FL=1
MKERRHFPDKPRKVWVKTWLAEALGMHHKTCQRRFAWLGYDPQSVKEYLVAHGYKAPSRKPSRKKHTSREFGIFSGLMGKQ